MPGHSRGSICLHDRENKLLFTGDVVYDGHMIDWLPYSHVSDYVSSCERLVGLVDSEQANGSFSLYIYMILADQSTFIGVSS